MKRILLKAEILKEIVITEFHRTKFHSVVKEIKNNDHSVIIETTTTHGAEYWKIKYKTKEKPKALKLGYLNQAYRVSRFANIRNGRVRVWEKTKLNKESCSVIVAWIEWTIVDGQSEL